MSILSKIKSKMHGGELTEKDGMLYSEHDGFYYNQDGMPLKSKMHGGPLLPRGDGLFYCEEDEQYYNQDGTPLKSKMNGAPLLPRGDGLFFNEYDDQIYDKNGNVVNENKTEGFSKMMQEITGSVSREAYEIAKDDSGKKYDAEKCNNGLEPVRDDKKIDMER